MLVTVEVNPGYDVGVVSLTGELVRMQMKRKEVKDNYELKKILRKAKQEEIEKWQEARKQEKGHDDACAHHCRRTSFADETQRCRISREINTRNIFLYRRRSRRFP
jgi:hypothetical protein